MQKSQRQSGVVVVGGCIEVVVSFFPEHRQPLTVTQLPLLYSIKSSRMQEHPFLSENFEQNSIPAIQWYRLPQSRQRLLLMKISEGQTSGFSGVFGLKHVNCGGTSPFVSQLQLQPRESVN